MQVAVVGAGVAGLATAKVLRELGEDVVVYDASPDVGGVWSATRSYPGIRTQNDKGTYRFSDLAMPRDYPEFPSGAQVRAYLQDYADRAGLQDALRLGTEVVRASPTAGGWSLVLRTADGSRQEAQADHLVVANGIFSRPYVPELPGAEPFEAAGGRVLVAGHLQDVEPARGRHVLVLGYGKTACDVGVAISAVAASTTVVARHLLWKMPAKVGGVLHYKYLMLTRLGEGLFRSIEPRGMERLLHGPADPARRGLLRGLQAVVTRQLRLRRSGLLPGGRFEDIARSTVSLVSDGFHAAVDAGRIRVVRDAEVVRLLERDGRPHAELTTGQVLPADLVVCGTGYRQDVPFLEPEVLDRLLDAHGDFRLLHQVQPLDVPTLSFAGYNSSLFSPLSAEMAAVWIGAFLRAGRRLPPRDATVRRIDERLAWMRERTAGRHARGTNNIPFSMHNVDELLADLGLGVSRGRRALEWLLPVRPSAYRSVVRRLQASPVLEPTARREPVEV